MDIEATLRRTVEKYRQKSSTYPGRILQSSTYPGRILLKGEAAQAFADLLIKRRENLGLTDLNKRTPDELFLDGGMSWFKSIPVIAELPSEREIVIDWAE